MNLRRAGFTLIEILLALTIVGLLARIAIPRVGQFRVRAHAARIVGDLEVVRLAAFNVAVDSARWPEASGAGTIPPDMTTYLPSGLSFTPEPGVSYVWRLTGMPGGDPNQATAGTTMGMGAEVADDNLREELQRQLATQVTMTSGNSVYWLIWGPSIRP